MFARSVEDAALVAEVLYGSDPQDLSTRPAPHPRLLEQACSAPPVRPMFAFVRAPFWDRADEQTHAAFRELTDLLGEYCFEADLPTAFGDAPQILQTINFAEAAKHYARYFARGRDAMAGSVRAAIEKGNAIAARDYIAALDWREVFNAGIGEIFERCDAIITPAAPGPAPAGLETTGDPVFNGLWSLCGTPAVTIPVLEAENGLPMGVQLVGPRGHDGRLLRTARWLSEFITDAN